MSTVRPPPLPLTCLRNSARAARRDGRRPMRSATDEVVAQFGRDLVKLANSQAYLGRADRAGRSDADEGSRDRADVMATNDAMSHTESDGTKVLDRLIAAGMTWYARRRDHAWNNNYPIEYTTAEAIAAWWESPGHRAIMVSTGYNYVGFGAGRPADGKFIPPACSPRCPTRPAPWSGPGPPNRWVDATPSASPSLEGQRHAPPGADCRSPLLRGQVAARRWWLALVGNDDRHGRR